MSDHRDLFNELVCSSVEAMLQTDAGRQNLSVIGENRIMTRESISEYLWDAHRLLNGRDSMGWCNLLTYKLDGALLVEILASKRPKKVHQRFIIPTRLSSSTNCKNKKK